MLKKQGLGVAPSPNAMKYLVVAISDDRTTIKHSTTHDDSMLARVWFGSFRPGVLGHLDERGDSVGGVKSVGFAGEHEVGDTPQHPRQIPQQFLRRRVLSAFPMGPGHRYQFIGCGPVLRLCFGLSPCLILRGSMRSPVEATTYCDSGSPQHLYVVKTKLVE